TMETEMTFDPNRVFDSEFNGKTLKTIEAPVDAGEVVGHVRFLLKGEVLAETDLIARDSVTSNSLLSGLHSIRDFLFGSEQMKKIMRVVLILVIVWAVLALAVFIIRLVLKRRRKRMNRTK
ncbi:MAG: hypothetical protein J5843_03340, partial [Clostridia bacterium]|nr:hypothetical protein [Clostridia bacterium]